MEKPQYIDWIVEETGIVIKDDIPLKCYKIDYKDDESILDDWALHIRRNYIEDTELKEDADDNAMTVEQYLHDYVIPQKGEELGATVRSADITEILISDLLEFVHQYSVPRYKLKNRSGKTIHNKELMSLHISTKMKIKLQMIKMNWWQQKLKLPSLIWSTHQSKMQLSIPEKMNID